VAFIKLLTQESKTNGLTELHGKDFSFQEPFMKGLWNSLRTTRNSWWSTWITLRITAIDWIRLITALLFYLN